MGNLSARTKKECKETKTSVRILGGEGRQRCAGTMAFNKFPDYSSQVWIPFRSVLSMLKAGSGEHKKQPTISIPMSEFSQASVRQLFWYLRFDPNKLPTCKKTPLYC